MNKKNQWMFALPMILVVIVAGVLILQSSGSQSNNETTNAPVVSDISPADYTTQFVEANQQHLLIDVRTAEEYAGGHIANSINISVDAIGNRLSEIPRDQPVVVYCRSGNRSAQAAQILAGAGYTNIRDLGGIIDWTAQGYPVQ